MDSEKGREKTCVCTLKNHLLWPKKYWKEIRAFLPLKNAPFFPLVHKSEHEGSATLKVASSLLNTVPRRMWFCLIFSKTSQHINWTGVPSLSQLLIVGQQLGWREWNTFRNTSWWDHLIKTTKCQDTPSNFAKLSATWRPHCLFPLRKMLKNIKLKLVSSYLEANMTRSTPKWKMVMA